MSTFKFGQSNFIYRNRKLSEINLNPRSRKTHSIEKKNKFLTAELAFFDLFWFFWLNREWLKKVEVISKTSSKFELFRKI